MLNTHSSFSGLQVIVDRHLCEIVFVRWRRPHRKKRIAKKWQKKYGAVSKCVQEKAYRMGNRVMMCPHLAEQFKKGLSQLSA